jgi:hypothetical protein
MRFDVSHLSKPMSKNPSTRCGGAAVRYNASSGDKMAHSVQK